MAKENPFMNEMRARGLVDDREIAVMADIASTNGNRGRAFALLSGTTLYLYEAAGFATLGDLIEVIELSRAKFLKGSSFVLHTSMKIQYNDFVYTFQGFTQAARFIVFDMNQK